MSADIKPASAPMTTTSLSYPLTRRENVVETLHGAIVHDPYRWLESDTSQEVVQWTNAQDQFAHQILSSLPQRARFIQHLRSLMYAGDVHTPQKRGNAYFYWKRNGDQEKLTLSMRDGLKGTERVILDPNAPRPDRSTMSVTGSWVSPSGRYVAYKSNSNSADAGVLKIRDLNTGRDLEEEIPGILHNDIAWVAPAAGFFYKVSSTDATISNAQKIIDAQVKYHQLGTSVSKDTLVRDRAGNADIDEMPMVSEDGRWLCLMIDHGYTQTDVIFRDLKRKQKDWTTIVTGRDAINRVSIYRNRFYIRTNDGAPRYKVVFVDPEHPQRENWKVVVPERADATLNGMRVVGGHLVLQWLKDAVSQLEIRNLQTGATRHVAFNDLGTLDEVVGGVDDHEVFVRFSSFTLPATIYKIDVRTAEKELFAELPPAPDARDYLTEQTYFLSKDGTRVPMFIVRNKAAQSDGKRPTLLYGYGGFEKSLVPVYRPAVLAWLREGGIYAAPNLRGGGEFGAEWHRAGMLDKKQNVFDDFIAAAEHLVRQGWTKPQFIAAKGQSNGGLLGNRRDHPASGALSSRSPSCSVD